MSRNVSNYPSLLIVSDTGMYKRNGENYAFSSVVLEIEHYKDLFSSITWIGFNRPDQIGNPTYRKVPKDVRLIMLPKSGGDNLSAKLGVLVRTPLMAIVILKEIIKHDVIHTRAPSSPAFLAVLFSWLFPKKKFWNKYAGNWTQENPPFFYGLQSGLFKLARHTVVTINGIWPDQPAHCLSFENPCLTEEDRKAGEIALSQKSFQPPWNLCFVGRLEKAKGVDRILDALKTYPHPKDIEVIHFVGDGPERPTFEAQAQELKVCIQFHGILPRERVFKIYGQCHFFLLPSDSEGFPKVIAEAANFGCVPIASAVSSIPHYIINGENGFLWKPENGTFAAFWQRLMQKKNQVNWQKLAENAHQKMKSFTYERYNRRIQNEIVNE